MSARIPVEEDGFAVVPAVLPASLRAGILAAFEQCPARAGRRDGLGHDAVRALAASPAVGELVHTVLGARAFAVRATLFDKTTASDWLVAWHQDVTVPVRERRDAEGFSARSTKDGVPCARAPVAVLEAMLAVRVHVDGAGEDAGPVRVLRGTHRRGILPPGEIEDLRNATAPVTCVVPAGGAVVLRPLLLHASSKTRADLHRYDRRDAARPG